MTKKKVILLTGGTSRLGNVIALALIARGHTVYATSRKSLSSDNANLHFVKIDITSDGDIRRAVAKIIKDEKRIDVIINNAGVTLSGPGMTYSSEDFKKLLDINVIGPFRVITTIMNTASVKPRLIINITSLNGFLSLPNFGLYSASKFALEALGLAFHYEFYPTTHVVNLAPGALKAESGKKLTHKPAREKFPILEWLIPLTSLDVVAECIIQLLDLKSVPPRVVIGRDAKIILFMQKVLPFSIFDRIIFYISQKK